MIDIPSNLRLKEILSQPGRFPVGVELVSTRGTMRQSQTLKVRAFSEWLTATPRVDWVSITDNAGGNPQLAPIALGTPVLYGGKEVVVHLTCKDMNRYALESQLWLLASQGFHNILALTGDYPMEGFEGRAKPVFDIDSVGLLTLIRRLNEGLIVSHTPAPSNPGSGTKTPTQPTPPPQPPRRLEPTHFFAGAVVNPFKWHENTLLPQYAKLEAKLRAGAASVTNQIGFDSRKAAELIAFLRLRGHGHIPLIGNVYVLTPFVARLFHEMRIPGVTLSHALYELCERQRTSPDRGKAFFLEFAAKQLAIYRGLGYRAGYLGGVHNPHDVERILDIEASFSPDDWRQFAREIQFPQDTPGDPTLPNAAQPRPIRRECFLFAQDTTTLLPLPGELTPPARAMFEEPAPTRDEGTPIPEKRTPNPEERTPTLEERTPTPEKHAPTPAPASRAHITPLYHLSRLSHKWMFTPGRALAPLATALCRRTTDPCGPLLLRGVEHLSKALLFRCQECGDCSLFDTGYLCPESQCAKNQRNGPCGGSRGEKCEVLEKPCIWARAYARRQHEGHPAQLLAHAPVIQNQALRNTSSWANFWLARDHAGKGTAQ